MKTTMKKTMKTILSIFMVTVLFYACDTGTNLPAPLNLDCNGIENGLSVADECGTCHQSYVYDFVTHVPTYINDTTGLVLGATEMIVIAGSPEDIASNPNWNTGCTE